MSYLCAFHSRWSAVARGAVYRGLDIPDRGLITTRLARKHYGTPVSSRYNPKLHGPNEWHIDRYTNEKMVSGEMSWLGNKGERLPEDDKKTISIILHSHHDLEEIRVISSELVGCSADEAPRKRLDESE